MFFEKGGGNEKGAVVQQRVLLWKKGRFLIPPKKGESLKYDYKI